MRFLTRRTKTKPYKEQFLDKPIIEEHLIREEDIWHSNWFNYYIEKVETINGELIIYALKERLTQIRRERFYKAS